MKTIFVDAIYGNLEGDMPQLEISVSYDKNAKQYRLYCCPCRHSGSCTESMFGVTQCGATLETVARGNAKMLEKWEQWAEDHKQGILKAFSLAGQELHATRDAIKAYVEEWGGKKYEGNDNDNLNPNDNLNDKKEAKITVDAKQLQDAMKDVASIVGKRNALPVLDNILMEIKPGKLYLTTQQGTELRYSVNINGESEGTGSFLIDAAMGKKMKCGKGKVTITATENDKEKIDVVIGNVAFESEATKQFPTPHDFGNIDDAEWLTFSLTDEHKAVSKCAEPESNANLRPAMTGIYFDTDFRYIVASDGHVMRAVKTDFDNCVGGFIVRRKAFDLMKGDVRMFYNKNDFNTYKNGMLSVDYSYFMAQWADGTHQIIAMTMAERYPNWKSVVPRLMPLRYQFNADEVRAAISAICNAIDCKKYDRPAKFRITDGSDTVEIMAKDIDFNITSNHKVHLDKPAQGNFEIGLNPELIRTIVGNDWDGTIYMMDASRAVIFGGKREGTVLLVMPMLIQEEPFPYEAKPVEGDYTTFEWHDYSKDSKTEPVKEEAEPEQKSADPIHEPTDADDIEQKANDYEPRPEGWIPPMPQYVMWVDEDKQQPDMVAGIYKYNEVVKHVSENDATIYHKITSGDGFVLALETSLYLPAVDKMVTFSFYTGKDLGEVCKLTNGDKVAVYTWEEGMQALDILHQVNKDIAM